MEENSEEPTPEPTPVRRRSLVYDFPLRPKFLVQFVVPTDLTALEARRLRAFLMTLAEDFRGFEEGASDGPGSD